MRNCKYQHYYNCYNTYSGRENLMRTASKQKALTHTAVIKPQVCLLFTCKQINKIKIH